jgi:hypothetical protein
MLPQIQKFFTAVFSHFRKKPLLNEEQHLEVYLRRLGFQTTEEWKQACNGVQERSGRTTRMLLRALYYIDSGTKHIALVGPTNQQAKELLKKLQVLAVGAKVNLKGCRISTCTPKHLRGMTADKFFVDHTTTALRMRM